MKRRSLLLISQIAAVVLMTSPATAAVYLNCTDIGNGVIELSYDANEEQVPIRAFALDISVSGAEIILIDYLNPHYWVYPGSIIVDECGLLPFLSPVCDGSLGTPHITVEMGSLYIGEANAPPRTGVLLTFMISAECDVTVEENALRGGVVMEDTSHPSVYSPGMEGALPPEPGVYGVYGGGSGTADEPFLIFSAEQLNTIGLNPAAWHKHFRLMADIDLSGYTGTDLNIIGTSMAKSFGGTFDGNNHKIYNLSYDCSEADFVSLFGCVNGSDALIKDLSLVNPNISIQTGLYVSSLVGCLGTGTISACSANGGSVAGGSFVGGLVGWNSNGIIVNCHATSSLMGQCGIGGLVGKTYVEVSNCYSTGNITQGATVAGGFAGYNDGVISSSFWDEDTSGQAEGAGGTGQSAVTDVTGMPTSLMQTKSTFAGAGWDFKGETANGTQDIWTICEAKTYPRLVRKGYIGDFVGSDAVDLKDFAILASAWRKTPGDDDWNGNCDISEPVDGLIDELDLSIFASSYLIGAP
jgi:hypothetical protein